MAHKLGWLAEDYGAVGDGVANDASAFTSLITAMATRTSTHGQQHVALGPKTYRVQSTITLNASGLQIHGHNRVDSIIEGGASLAAGAPVIDVVAGSGNTQLSDIHLGNVQVRRVTANGPLIRFRGVRGACVSNCILGACNAYVVIDKPGSAENLHILLTMLDCTGSPAVGIDAADVDALVVTESSIQGAGAGAHGVRINTGDTCTLRNLLFKSCTAAPVYLRSATNFLMVGSGREGSITQWFDADSACTGVLIGRRLTTAPSGTWNMFGPLDNPA